MSSSLGFFRKCRLTLMFRLIMNVYSEGASGEAHSIIAGPLSRMTCIVAGKTPLNVVSYPLSHFSFSTLSIAFCSSVCHRFILPAQTPR